MKLKHIAVILVFVLVLLLSISCKKKENASENISNPNVNISVSGKTMKPQFIRNTLKLGGSINAFRIVSVFPDQKGTLLSIKVEKGDFVKKGQVLAIVDYSQAGTTFLRAPIEAPVAGRISKTFITEGNEVSQQQSLVEIIDSSRLELKMAVSEKYVSYITKGTKGILNISALNTGSSSIKDNFDVSVTSSGKVLSTNSSSMNIIVTVSDPTKYIKSGMYGELILILEEKENTLVIPQEIISERYINGVSTKGVFVIDDAQNPITTVSFRPIKTGIEARHMEDKVLRVEVLDGLEVNDVIVIKGYNSLADKIQVRIFELDGVQL